MVCVSELGVDCNFLATILDEVQLILEVVTLATSSIFSLTCGFVFPGYKPYF